VSAVGLVPVLELAEQAGLSELIGEHVDLPSTRVKSGPVNPAGKLTSIIAGMMCGADCIHDADVLRAGCATNRRLGVIPRQRSQRSAEHAKALVGSGSTPCLRES